MAMRLWLWNVLFWLSGAEDRGPGLLGGCLVFSPNRMFLNGQLPDHRPGNL